MSDSFRAGQPWLSVIMPTYNGAQTIGRALESLCAELDSGCELIAIDDGSSDDTLEILKSYQSRLPMRIFSRQVRSWVANTNHGLGVATGQYACFVHQDDFWLPGRVAAIRNQLNRTPEVTLLLHACEFVDPKDRVLGPWHCPLPARQPLHSRRVFESLLVQNFVPLPGVTFHRETALKVSGLDETLWYTADWDLWLKLAATGPTVYLPERLAAFRIHPGSQTAMGSRGRDAFREQMDCVRRRHLQLWDCPDSQRREVVNRVSCAVIEINVALASAYHRQAIDWSRLYESVRSMNLADWRRLFRDSRMRERVWARVRAGFIKRHPAPVTREPLPELGLIPTLASA